MNHSMTKVIIATRIKNPIVEGQNVTTLEDIVVESHIYLTLVIPMQIDIRPHSTMPTISMTLLIAIILHESLNSTIGMHSPTSTRSSQITFLILTTLIQFRHLHIQFTTLSIMAPSINQGTHAAVVEAEDIDQYLGIELILLIRKLTDNAAIDQEETMIQRVSTASLRTNWIWLTNAQNSLRTHHKVVKSHSLYGEEMVRRRDAATANNVKTNGSLSAHPAL